MNGANAPAKHRLLQNSDGPGAVVAIGVAPGHRATCASAARACARHARSLSGGKLRHACARAARPTRASLASSRPNRARRAVAAAARRSPAAPAEPCAQIVDDGCGGIRPAQRARGVGHAAAQLGLGQQARARDRASSSVVSSASRIAMAAPRDAERLRVVPLMIVGGVRETGSGWTAGRWRRSRRARSRRRAR